ncbi:hypothetical protein HY932_02730 [Candidatus Falkowbacteria bacterium]|nr:hypothetical protein [Candidatus Falkowbacteria bacterium]
MEVRYHKNLAEGKWFTLSVSEQMGNIGSEVGRAIKRKQAGDVDRLKSALDRALELFDLTMSDPRWLKTRRLREVARAREVVCDLFFGDNIYGSTFESLEKYFFQFAVAARINK